MLRAKHNGKICLRDFSQSVFPRYSIFSLQILPPPSPRDRPAIANIVSHIHREYMNSDAKKRSDYASPGILTINLPFVPRVFFSLPVSPSLPRRARRPELLSSLKATVVLPDSRAGRGTKVRKVRESRTMNAGQHETTNGKAGRNK